MIYQIIQIDNRFRILGAIVLISKTPSESAECLAAPSFYSRKHFIWPSSPDLSDYSQAISYLNRSIGPSSGLYTEILRIASPAVGSKWIPTSDPPYTVGRRFVALCLEGILSAPQHGLKSDHLIGVSLYLAGRNFCILSRSCIKYIKTCSILILQQDIAIDRQTAVFLSLSAQALGKFDTNTHNLCHTETKMPLPDYWCHTKLHPSFKDDILDTHLIYDYDAQDGEGNPEKWRYEFWFFSENRVVYSIHGGPMKGRQNYQTCAYQCIRPGEIWQCNFLE